MLEKAASAGSAYELARGYRIRWQIGTGASHQSFEDIKSAVSAAARFTEESGSAQEELSCLRLLADEHVIRHEYQAAVDVQRRRAELAHRFEATWLYGREIDAYQQLTAIYLENLGEPTLAYEAAERVRALLDATVISTDPADFSTLAGAYFALGSTPAMLGQSVAALEYWDTGAMSQH